VEVVLNISIISGHFECAYVTKKHSVEKWASKITMHLLQGLVGQSQGCNGVVGGVFLTFWHDRQERTTFSIS